MLQTLTKIVRLTMKRGKKTYYTYYLRIPKVIHNDSTFNFSPKDELIMVVKPKEEKIIIVKRENNSK